MSKQQELFDEEEIRKKSYTIYKSNEICDKCGGYKMYSKEGEYLGCIAAYPDTLNAYKILQERGELDVECGNE